MCRPRRGITQPRSSRKVAGNVTSRRALLSAPFAASASLRFPEEGKDGRWAFELRAPSELIPQSKLDQTGRDRSLVDHPERRGGVSKERSIIDKLIGRLAIRRNCELRVVEQVKELGAELERLPFADPRNLDERKIKV